MRDNNIPLPFPHGGLDVSQEFHAQPPGTTADELNVQSREMIGHKNRGGSRPCLAKLLNDQHPEGANLIQHLDVIVDPRAEFLPPAFDTPTEDWVEHPRFPDTFYPPGGSPDQPNPNTPQSNPSALITRIQKKLEYVPFNSSSSDRTITFTDPVQNGSIMVVFVATQDDQFEVSGAIVDVENAAATDYTQLGSYARMTKNSTIFSLSCWIRQAASGGNEDTVRVRVDNNVSMALWIAEYSGMDPAGAFDDFQKAEHSTSQNPMSVGPIAVEGLNQLILGAFMGGLAVDTVTPGAGYTQLDSIDGSAGDLDILLYILEDQDVDNPTTPTITATWDGGADRYCAIGVSFKD